MGAVVQTAMVSAIGSARYTPVTASGQRCSSEQLIAFVHKITYVHIGQIQGGRKIGGGL